MRWRWPFAEGGETRGVGLRTAHIIWSKHTLQLTFHATVTTTAPHRPFEHRSFDLIYAGSVFTHMDDLVDPWRLELRGALKPSGRLHLTNAELPGTRALDTPFIPLADTHVYRPIGDSPFRATRRYSPSR